MKTLALKQLLLAVIFCTALAGHGFTQTIKVADFASSRTLYVSTYSYNLTSGTEMVSGKAKLTNTANFGTSGIVTHPLNITGGLFAASGSVTAAALAPYDIVFLTLLTTPLTTAEQDALYTWSQQPGKVVISCEAQSYEKYSTRSGYGIANGNVNPTTRVATGDDIYHLFSGGIFGNATSIIQTGAAQGYFNADCFSAVIAKNSNNNTTILFNAITRDIYFADGGFFTSGPQTASGMTAGGTITSSTDKVWANTWAWAVNEVLNPGSNSTSPIVSSNTSICTANDGTITITAPLGNNTLGQAYQYSLDGTNYQTNPTFIGLSPGTYTLHVKTNACTDV